MGPADRKIIEETLRRTLRAAEFHWLDPRGDGLQPQLVVATPDFKNLTRFQQHERVRQALLPLGEPLEAFALRTTLPEPGFPLGG